MKERNRLLEMGKETVGGGGIREPLGKRRYRIPVRKMKTLSIKTESIRKLNVQWTKSLHPNNLNNIEFFFYIFQGL